MRKRLDDSERITLNLDAASAATLRDLARQNGDNVSLATRRLIENAKRAGLVQPVAKNHNFMEERHD